MDIKVVNITQCLEAMFFCVTSSFSKTIIGVCFRATNCDATFSSDLCTLLLEIQKRSNDASVVRFEDFKFPNID